MDYNFVVQSFFLSCTTNLEMAKNQRHFFGIKKKGRVQPVTTFKMQKLKENVKKSGYTMFNSKI